ncbi:MAG: DUF1800 domain-containing protein [Deltaproteobacteria bacterium]|nr:DUF1800 domain-containing protein [Deltaproteobacteria bacterium]
MIRPSIRSGNLSPGQCALHVLNRLAFGPRPGDIDDVKQIGVEDWIESQLRPDSIPEPSDLRQQIASLQTLRMTPQELFIRYQVPHGQLAPGQDKNAARQESKIILQQAVQARIIRAIAGPRQLQEVMTAFWFNHFNVFAGKGLCHLWVGSFEQEAIRPYTLGRFRELLGATAKHPAMLFYLDNWQNTAPNSSGAHGKFEGINENYARELMELHTLGVNGGYSQADVIALAHVLTGWGFVHPNAAIAVKRPSFEGAPVYNVGALVRRFGFGLWHHYSRPRRIDEQFKTGNGFNFDPRRHDFGAQTLLGHHISSGGLEQGESALDILARSPATAHHLSYQLAQYFVADNPPSELVQRMARRYLVTDGNLRDVLQTLFFSSEFWDRRYYGMKFKTPYEFVISATRAAGVPVVNVRPLAGTMASLGMPLYGCQTPDGYKQTQEAWLSPDAMMTRLSFATALGTGRLPLQHPVDELTQDESRPVQEGAAMRPVAMRTASASMNVPAEPDPMALAFTVGDLLSPHTRQAVEAAPPRLRAPLILGSPEFMMR